MTGTMDTNGGKEDGHRESDAQDHPLTREEAHEEALENSMDASDPPSTTKPGDNGDPVPSSGFSNEKDDEDDKD